MSELEIKEEKESYEKFLKITGIGLAEIQLKYVSNPNILLYVLNQYNKWWSSRFIHRSQAEIERLKIEHLYYDMLYHNIIYIIKK